MRRLVILVAVMVISIAAFAQKSFPISIQPKAGLNIAHVSHINGSGPRYGLVAGAEVEVPLSTIFGVSAGLLYSQQGATFEDTYSGITCDETLQADYLNIPIMANIYIVKGLTFKCGVQPGFNVKDNLKVDPRGNKSLGSVSVSGKTDLKSFAFAIPLGLSYEYKNVVLDARYNLGLTTLWDQGDEKYGVIQITLGYKFQL